MPRMQQKKNVVLQAVFGVLVIVVLVLVVGVAIVVVKNNAGDKCLKEGDAYDVEACINSIYDDRGRDDAMSLYDRAIDKAYSAGDEQKFYSLLMDKANALVSRDGDCEAALNAIGDERVRNLSNADQKGVFYSEVIGLAITCNNTEMGDEYTKKLADLNNSGEIEIYAY